MRSTGTRSSSNFHSFALLLAIAIVVTSVRSADVEAQEVSGPTIGVSAVPANYSDYSADWYDVFQRAQALGAEVVQIPAEFWYEAESPDGEYAWSTDTEWFRTIWENDFSFRISKDFPGPFFHDQIMAPGDVSFTAFTETKFLRRYFRMIDAYVDNLGPATDYILIHAEGAYNYFDQHPEQLEDFADFLRRVRRRIRERAPHIRVAVNIDPHNEDIVLKTIASVVDFVSFDVMRTPGLIETPHQLRAEINRLLNVVGNRKIAVAVYWSTSSVDGGSDASQKAAFEATLQTVSQRQGRFEYVVFGNIFDDDVDMLTDAFAQIFSFLPLDFAAEIADSQAGQGIIRTDGTVKPSWWALRRGISELKASR
ncbi:MAG: hypothetical protein R3E01_15495 [Pirellulaceae bacterium]|nr:hypothetical protein [Planctomycetales bacterium]